MSNRPRFKQTTIKAQVKAVEQGKKTEYPVYKFSGKTFVKKD